MKKKNNNSDTTIHPEVELVNNSITLSQANNPKAHLSAVQKRFNTLSKQINKQKELFADLPKKEAYVRDYYDKYIRSVYLQEKELEVKNLQLMDQRLGEWKFTKKRKQKVIYEILTSADLIMTEFDEDTEIYQICKAFEVKYQDKKAIRDEIEIAATMLETMFGFDASEFVDEATSLDDFMRLVEEEMAKQVKNAAKAATQEAEDNDSSQFFNEEFEAEFEAERERQRNDPKLTPKQKQQAEMEQKSLRAIYIELVRQLHPDTAVDEIEKEEKEARMKDLTTAYRDKDLYTLLGMQLQWMSESKVPLAQQTDEVLAKYNTLMNKQLKSLKQEYEALRYHSIAGVSKSLRGLHFESDKVVSTTLAREKYHIEKLLESQTLVSKYLDNKREFFHYVDIYLDDEDDDDLFDFLK